MSVIVATGEAISKSPINSSKSKQMFSFSKSSRFPKVDRRNYSDAIYSLPEIKTKRSTTFGLGNKYDFTKGQKGINSQFYSNGTDFDKEHPYSPCFTFGAGRDKYEKVYYESNKMLDKSIPGPAKYYYLKPFGWDAAKFSMKGRNNNTSNSKTSKETSPGPGFYKNIYAINEKGKYPMSNVENIKSFSLINDKMKRFNYKCKQLIIISVF